MGARSSRVARDAGLEGYLATGRRSRSHHDSDLAIAAKSRRGHPRVIRRRLLPVMRPEGREATLADGNADESP